MKHPIICGALVLVASGGVAFLLANRPMPPADNSTPSRVAVAATEPTTSSDLEDPCPCCSTCRTGSAGVTDVVDLSVKFAVKSEARGEFVSFDEPPLAKPKGEVQPVGHELPDLREVLPPPREVK